ncbi:MAG: AAA family ATPase [Opitutales bacterium]
MALSLFIISLVFYILVLGYAAYLYKRADDLYPENIKKSVLLASIEQAQNTLTDLKEENAKLRDEKHIALENISQGNAMKAYIESNRDTEANLRAAIDKSKIDIKDVKDKLNKLTEELQQVSQELQDKQEARRHIDNVISLNSSKAEDLDTRINIAENSLKAAEAKLGALGRDIIEKTQELNGLDAKVKFAKEELDALKKEEKRIADSKDELVKKKETLEESIQNLEAKKSILSPAVLEYEAKQKHAEKARSEKWKDLENYNITTRISNPKDLDEQEFLSEFKLALKNNNIIFDERTINAFHTGLKVQESSPMVVLAGTSGTGKSLLPKLYAEFLGMDFLSIAVQPRWDSPQDMFGFYNYMEQQFKATELSRRLWSYDIYNNEICKYKTKNDLPMNIVLLDEMNLAKVEYYFSDMLSKLELRRTIDESTPEKRKDAEIELETSGTSDLPRRLYVGKNTLFVGTMNEDESTQSLSDKVMDRANVMRFGRPKDLNITPNLEQFTKTAKNMQMQTSLSSWDKFQSKNKGVNPLLEEFLRNINEELDKVGRPFAHRVFQAMSNYVNNYPNQSELGVKSAIADQVEMKILPKLNALEKDDPNTSAILNKIQESIYKLDDENLYKAFKRANEDSHNVFFQWRGIMR